MPWGSRLPDTGAMPHAQCYATLRISKPGVSSADVTARLGVAPTFAHEAGDVGRSGYVRREALWGLSSEHLGRGDLATHLTALLDQVAHCHDELDAMGSDGFNLDWFCFVDIDGTGGVTLEADVISWLASFPVALALDLYRSPGGYAIS